MAYRMKGTFAEVADGVWQQWPLTRKQAEIQKVVYYLPLAETDPCDNPQHGAHSIRYTKTGIARCCALAESMAMYTAAKNNGEPTSPAEAFKNGYDYYWKDTPGKQCGHVGKTLLNGKCYFCKNEKAKTPRQIAKDNGELWYFPEQGDLCNNGHNAKRRVNNGSCYECEQLARTDKTDPNRILMAESPDIVISREDAKTMGLKVYRTGEPCGRDHRGFRYVSTGNCLACMGRA